MNINIIKAKKNELEIEMDNLTIAELLRKFLWHDKKTIIAAWRKEHPTKNPIFVLKTKGNAKDVLLKAIDEIQQTNKEILKQIKKLK